MADHSEKKETTVTSAGRESAEHFGVVNTPVYRASTILYPDIATLDAHAMPFTYGRRGNPTVRSLEDAIGALEGSTRVALVPSGLNAAAGAIMAVCSAGDHLLMADSCYAPTRIFCDKTLRRFGVETTYYDPLIGAGIAALFKPNTRAVFCESPGSLTFEVQDVSAIAGVAHAHGAAVILDNTWATPIHFQPLKHGVDLSVQAVTKYIGGHADLMMGYIAANERHAARLSDFHANTGLYVSGDDCFLALRGLRTLPIRLKRHQETATALANWLQTRPEVSRVLYPALKGDPGHALWKRDFGGACGLFGVVLKPATHKGVAAMIDGLKHFGIGFSWGGYESLCVPADIRRTAGTFAAEGPVIRIHAGLEDPQDLIADLTAGLERLKSRVMTETLSHAQFVSEVQFNADGLVPVIAQRVQTGEVLMFAWMTRETLEATLATGHVTYWSRSRKKVWPKGEESGHIQRLVEAWIDCDGDVLLMKVDQIGPACHTGAPSCFFRETKIAAKP